MVDLVAKTPCAGLLPRTIGALTLSEVDAGALTSIAAYNDQHDALAKALHTAHGVSAPAANRTTGKAGARAIWFGQGITLLMGPEPGAYLAKHAALTDQSDAWACVQLKGAGAVDVLARLTPMDLRDSQFKRGHTARTDLQHMMASLTRTGADTWLIMVFRGFAETLVHDLTVAMETVRARQG
ncbi:MAG: sarcosine oxidase subunit gamma [Roseovarius sp.]